MTTRLLYALLALLILGPGRVGSEPAAKLTDVPGEILVKVSPEAEAAIEAARLQAPAQLPRTGLASLDALLTRYGATAILPLFPQAKDPELIKQQFPERAARAAVQSKLPTLFRFYKIVVPLETDLPAAVAELSHNPHIEAAQANHLATVDHEP